MSLTRTRITRIFRPQVERAGDDLGSVGDDRMAAGTKRGPAGMSGRPLRVYGVLAAFVLAADLVGALSMAHDTARGGRAYQLGWPLFWEFTSGIVTIGLLPLIRRGVRSVRRGATWWPLLGAVLALAVGFPVLHVLGMVALRTLGTVLIGMSYDFDWVTEFPYELRKDLVTVACLGAAFWVGGRPPPDLRPPDRLSPPISAGAAAPARDLWLRDGTTSLRVDPGDIVWVASAGNYVEFALASGKRHLVRGTLAAEAVRLAPFGFARVHRTRLVNLDRVSALTLRASGDFELGLNTGEIVVGSRRYRDAVAVGSGFVGDRGPLADDAD